MPQLKNDIQQWLNEDMPFGDITSMHLKDMATDVSARLLAKESGIICGSDVFDMVFEALDTTINIDWQKPEGAAVATGDLLATVKGPLDKILMGERLALNLLQRMSGIATLSSFYAKAVRDYPVRVVDTRKTTPGLRQLEKYAVRTGGCYNHRYSLSDAVMIKDNHIKAAGSITEAVTYIREAIPHTTKIEVEVETLEALEEAILNDVDIIMLDNMDNAMIAAAVKTAKGKAILEASGNMSLDRLPSVAATGVDVISVGALTHSVKALDISLKFA